MSYGFASVGSTGTTDRVNPAFTGDFTDTSFFIWTYNVGHGGGSRGRAVGLDDNATKFFLLFDNENNSAGTYAFNRSWSVNDGSWRFAAPAQNTWSAIGASYNNSGAAPGNDPTIYVDGSKLTVGS